MLEYCENSVLAGALSGKSALKDMLSLILVEPNSPDPELAILDFDGIEVATASFLRESVLTFRDVIRGQRSQFYPIVANLNEVVRDELLTLLQLCGGAMMTCTLSKSGDIKDASPLGELDPKQRLTFELVQQHGETDASALMREYGESEGIKHTTAWNNRLTGLVALGLVVERSQGRAKRYGPLVEGT